MTRVRKINRKVSSIVVAIVLSTAALISGSVRPVFADVLWLENRRLFVANQQPNAIVDQVISFTYPGGFTVGSLVFEYCTTSLAREPCIAPTGLDVSGVSLTSQSGITGYATLAATTNKLIFTRSATTPATTAASYTLSNIVNPSVPMTSYFIRMSTYASTNATGPIQNYGSVGTTITNPIQIALAVPPYLSFCVAIEIIGDCEELNGSFIQLGRLKSDQANFGKSEMMVATNGAFGYSIAVYGTTMTSGNKIIEAMETPGPSRPGTAQFGMNLAENTDPVIGVNPTGPGSGTVNPIFAVPDEYLFESGVNVVTNPGVSEHIKFTTSYIVNVAEDQPYGVYNTTITYICTGTF